MVSLTSLVWRGPLYGIEPGPSALYAMYYVWFNVYVNERVWATNLLSEYKSMKQTG